jgi:hypothetical protein
MVEKANVAAEEKAARSSEIETLVRKHIKHATLTEDAFKYMSLLIEEDSPGNARELFSLI